MKSYFSSGIYFSILEAIVTERRKGLAVWQAISIKNSKRTGVWNLGPNSDLGMKFRT